MRKLITGLLVLIALGCLAAVVTMTGQIFAATTSVPGRGLQQTPYPVRYNAATDVTVGNLSGELTSVSLQSDSTLVCIWVTDNDCIANWWSTSASDIGTTNGWYITKDSAPFVADGFVMSTTLWIASTADTSATAVVLEYK